MPNVKGTLRRAAITPQPALDPRHRATSSVNHHYPLEVQKRPILAYLPSVDYHGFDVSARYIESARRRFGARGTFYCGEFDERDARSMGQFDIVLAMGLLHHLSDSASVKVLHLARAVLCEGGRLLTVDPCICADQNPIARFLIEQDRGRHVRREPQYAEVAKRVFPSIHWDVEHRTWPPYTHIFMECTKD